MPRHASQPITSEDPDGRVATSVRRQFGHNRFEKVMAWLELKHVR